MSNNQKIISVTLAAFLGLAFLLTGDLTSAKTIRKSSLLKVTCPEIPAARQRVLAQYEQDNAEAAKELAESLSKAEAASKACLEKLWKGGPCDEQWQNLQESYQRAINNLSSGETYQQYQEAKSQWNSCYGKNGENWGKEYDKYNKNNKQGEERCLQQYRAQVEAANKKYENSLKKAQEVKDEYLKRLDELEKKCGQKPDKKQSKIGKDFTPGKPSRPESDCQPIAPPPPVSSVPDSLVNEMVTVAKEFDTYGISDLPLVLQNRLFAVYICGKIRNEVANLLQFQSDARTPAVKRSMQNRIDKLRRVQTEWCNIAAGKPSRIPKLEQTVNQIGGLRQPACKVDADCGKPVSYCCADNKKIAQWRCNQDKQCERVIIQCVEPQLCGGEPPKCLAFTVESKTPEETVEVLVIDGKYFPAAQFMVEVGPECEEVPHYHAKSGSVISMDNVLLFEPGGCGFGKVSEVEKKQVPKTPAS